jgi:hypothetical protein
LECPAPVQRRRRDKFSRAVFRHGTVVDLVAICFPPLLTTAHMSS